MSDLRLGSFSDHLHEQAEGSVDLILTDPPYGRAYRHLWSDVAREAARVLAPGGFFVAYSGNHGLPEVMRRVSDHLEYYWLAILVHQRCPWRKEVRVVNAARPLLVFYKPPRKLPQEWFLDVIAGAGPEKVLHPWQQALDEAQRLVRIFSKPGDLVLDPFAGTGTTLLASRIEGRLSLGFEINARTFAIARERLQENTGSGESA